MHPNQSFGALKNPTNIVKSAFVGFFRYIYLYNILYKALKP